MVTGTSGDPSPIDHTAWRHALDEEDLHQHLTTLESWRQFIADAPAPPALLPTRQWMGLPEADRIGYDEARLDYHTRLRVVATSALRQVVHTGRRLTLLNRHALSARRGLIVSGPAGTRQDHRDHPVAPCGVVDGGRVAAGAGHHRLCASWNGSNTPSGMTLATGDSPSSWSTRSTTCSWPPAPAPRSPTR